MNKLILGTFFALCCLTAVRGLNCNICKFKVWSICFTGSSQAACAAPGQCFTTSTSLGSISLFKKLDCNASCANVNTTTDKTFSFDYTTTCCSGGDLCNSASAAKLSPFLGFALVSIWLAKLV